MWAHCTSAGKALLAELNDDALLALYPDTELSTLTSQSIGTRSALFAELESVRRHGFAHNSEESEVGAGSIGVAIRTGTATSWPQ
ncbi:IclR family transcriptional regulator C-terminal domain-containing protein [Pseudonocardia sp. WMMC193]|uniref:IclR family transcriptional regulator C-terminal domain-containing protein n=1 Tax=Pseudonocardia sp. WMMC193 TaxID=2911965 RepID=UPI001F4281A2|nr:IclR family transcriptional regulator C-terminal domain-containing protein [Pseudonocardia sp. WMMC193]MCF7552242.1 IclR family transcriptional regulator C-terminal domain-containing protein [Pseudonocardia sp. WMMC193]